MEFPPPLSARTHRHARNVRDPGVSFAHVIGVASIRPLYSARFGTNLFLHFRVATLWAFRLDELVPLADIMKSRDLGARMPPPSDCASCVLARRLVAGGTGDAVPVFFLALQCRNAVHIVEHVGKRAAFAAATLFISDTTLTGGRPLRGHADVVTPLRFDVKAQRHGFAGGPGGVGTVGERR